jgi:hypothetical protein
MLKPARLWKNLSAERRLDTAVAFWAESEDMTSQAEAIDAIARHLKFRARSVTELPADKRARYLCALPAVSDSLAARLLVTYHLTAQRPMMAAFLDALGVPHADGLITADDVKVPDADTCRAAAKALMDRFPEADTTTYFATLVVQDPETWKPLEEFVGAS